MFYVVFESTVVPSQQDVLTRLYLKLQKKVRHSEGFVAETGFSSPDHKDKALFISKFQDEDSVHRWRTEAAHLKVQNMSRDKIFSDYRIRAGPELEKGVEAGKISGPGSSEIFDSTKVLMLVEYPKTDIDCNEEVSTLLSGSSRGEITENTTYTNETSTVHILSWRDAAGAHKFSSSLDSKSAVRVNYVAVVRDYGQNDRDQAPKGADQLQAKI